MPLLKKNRRTVPSITRPPYMEELRQKRESMNMTQYELALVTGYARNTITHIERSGRCSIQQFIDMANALDMEVKLTGVQNGRATSSQPLSTTRAPGSFEIRDPDAPSQ